MKSAMAKFQLITYDVCGNAKDGYEVNDCHSRGVFEVPESTFDINDQGDFRNWKTKVMKALRKAGVFHRTHARSIRIDGESAYTLYFEREKDAYPLCELRRITDK